MLPIIGSIIAGAIAADQLLPSILQLVFFVMKFVLAVMIIAQLVTRIMLIDLYIIFSAPCIACTALPGRSGQPVTRMWLQGFLASQNHHNLETASPRRNP